MRLRRVEPVLRRALTGPCRVPAGSTLLVAVSGGADSTALLVGLASLAREFGLALHAAHLHHGLRGLDADADLEHVRALSASLGVPLAAARWDCRARMRRRALTGEAGLRTLRRQWLSHVARRWRAVAIATAHTADDQLETLLMRLARGTGLTGMSGMRARRGAWLKPLLECTRADLEHDLARAGLTWREDASNATPAHARNRIRHGVVPALLDAIGAAPDAPAPRRAGLARRATALARELAQAESTLARAAARALRRMLRETADGPALDVPALAALPVSLQRPVLRRAWRLLGPTGPAAEGLTSRHLEPVLSTLAGGTARAQLPLPAGWRAVLAGGLLKFAAPRAGRGPRSGRSQRVAPPDARLPLPSVCSGARPTSGAAGTRRT